MFYGDGNFNDMNNIFIGAAKHKFQMEPIGTTLNDHPQWKGGARQGFRDQQLSQCPGAGEPPSPRN